MGGNSSKKLAAKCTLLNRDEQKSVGHAFSLMTRSDKIRENDVARVWGPQTDPRLVQYLTNFLMGCGDGKGSTADFQRFAELYVYSVRGTVEERLIFTYNCLGEKLEENKQISYQLFKEFCETMASTFMKMMRNGGSRVANGWINKGFRARSMHVQALGESLAADVAAAAGHGESAPQALTSAALAAGLGSDGLMKSICELVFRHLFGTVRSDSSYVTSDDAWLLPVSEGVQHLPEQPSIVDLSHMVWLNCHLPPGLQNKWRFLFSSRVHGESFSTMLGRIINEGPSVLIVEDEAGYLFGGFASESWEQGPNFHGTDESLLFTLAPKMRCYRATGYNNHYQYLNTNQKTMPNGLMMGGQFEFGGLWLDYEFGSGTSAESCSTYRGYKQLSKQKRFTIRAMEVWGVGDKQTTSDDEEGARERSVLDGNSEAKALLMMSGRQQHSEGLREPEPL